MNVIKLFTIFFFVAVFIWCFFTIAGRWNWISGWGYLLILITCSSLNDFILWLKNPELLRLRGRFGHGTKTWDKVCLTLFGMAYVSISIIGALDAGRYQWSNMPNWLWPIGAALFVGGQFLVTWAMVINPFFEKTARIQKERNQTVIINGPYRYIRHPGYTGTIIGFVLGTPLMLSSWWAFLPAIASAVILIIRISLEDRMLLIELEGYKTYSMKVRYRLIPYIW